jgi:hypothetical protein
LSTPTPGNWTVATYDSTGEQSIRSGHVLVCSEEAQRHYRRERPAAASRSGNMTLGASAKVLSSVLESIANYPAADEAALFLTQTLARAVVGKLEDAGAPGRYSAGPWQVKPSQYPRFRRDIVDAGGRLIACCTTQAGNTIEEVIANAEIIAAAPEALEALQAIATYPNRHPEKDANSVQIIALAALHKEVDVSLAETADRAREMLGLKRIETPYASKLAEVRERFSGATPGPWLHHYISSTRVSINGADPERCIGFLVGASAKSRALILAAPALQIALVRAIGELEHLSVSSDDSSRAYATRTLRSLSRPLKQTWEVGSRGADDESYNLLSEHGLPIGQLINMRPADRDLAVAAPALATSLGYAISALEVIESTASAPVDQRRVANCLDGRSGLRAVLQKAGVPIREPNTTLTWLSL